MAHTVLAVDVGGTKIAAGLVDETGRLIGSATRPTPVDHAEATFDAVRAAIGEVLQDGAVAIDAAGIACAGPVDTTTGTVSPINVAPWRDFPLRDRLRALLPNVPVGLAGDGLCMALGEHWLGAGAGSDSMLGMVVSTGVGGGLVLGGQPFPGRTGNAGHVGHVIAEADDGWPCTCGGRGCVETVASGPNLVRWARGQGWQAPPHADAAHLAAAALKGDTIPRAAFRRGGRAVGLSVAATAVVCDLELVVIGGGVAQAGDLLFEPIRETLATHARLSYVDAVRVVPAKLGTQAGLIGAAALALATTSDARRAEPDAVVLRLVRSGDFGWVVQRHGALYAAEYGWAPTFEALTARVVADYIDRHDPEREAAWIAELRGEPVGSVFCVRKDETTAKLRLLLVEPSARGHGVGSRLVGECISFARQAGYRAMELWTVDLLAAARRIYQRAGFTLVAEERGTSFGDDLVGQTWRLEL